MKHTLAFSLIFVSLYSCPLVTPAQINPVRLEFIGATLQENRISITGPGFGQLPQGKVSFGFIPTDNAFAGATDGQGAVIEAQPGQGVMILGPHIAAGEAALIRCSVRTEGPARVTLAAVGDEPDTFVSYNGFNDPSYCQNQYQRLSVYLTPPSTGFIPLVQILNEDTTPLVAYVDNLEAYPVAKVFGYHGEFLNSDEIDPVSGAITIPSPEGSGMMDWHGKSNGREPSLQPAGLTVDQSLKLEFNGSTAAENQVTLQGAGFGAYPQANVSFSYTPTAGAYEGATDGMGAVIEAQPGQGVMILGPEISNKDAAYIRCNVYTEGGSPSVTVAGLGMGSDPFVSVTTANNPACFEGRFRRICAYVTPPEEGFRPLLQVMNNSQTETLTAYVDNLEVVILDRFHYYWGEFLNGDENDPADGKIGVPVEEGANVWDESGVLFFLQGKWMNSNPPNQFQEILIQWDMWSTYEFPCKVLVAGYPDYITMNVDELNYYDTPFDYSMKWSAVINNVNWIFEFPRQETSETFNVIVTPNGKSEASEDLIFIRMDYNPCP